MSGSNELSSPGINLAGGWSCTTLKLNQERENQRSLHVWCPADTDAVLEQQLEMGDEGDPFWCYLWPTAQLLATQVLAVGEPMPERVLEVGCGSGVVGIAALMAGVGHVTFQDLRAMAVELALHNARVNGFEAQVAGNVSDWRGSVGDQFDWILASDVLYDVSLHTPLLALLEQAIAPAAGVLASSRMIWIGDPGRREAAEFLRQAQQSFSIELFDADNNPVQQFNPGQYHRFELRCLRACSK